jgi:hypothetical protein
VSGPELVDGKQVFTFQNGSGHKRLTMKAIIITGNPVEGFEFYWPFETELEAIEWANQDAHLDETWRVGKVHPPKEE